MAGFCVVAGLLIGAAAVPTLPGRPITLYAAFGALMGYAFWMFVSAVNQGNYLGLLPALLVVAGSAWLLRDPGVPAAIFTGVVVVVCLGLNAAMYANRFSTPSTSTPTSSSAPFAPRPSSCSSASSTPPSASPRRCS